MRINKRIIKLNEGTLRKIIRETVKKTIKEGILEGGYYGSESEMYDEIGNRSQYPIGGLTDDPSYEDDNLGLRAQDDDFMEDYFSRNPDIYASKRGYVNSDK